MVFSRKLSAYEIQELQKIQEFARQAHAHSESHDYAHVLTVCRDAIKIAKAIPDQVDPFVIIAAALLHDIGKTNNIFSHIHGLFGGALAEEFLDGLEIDQHRRDRVCNAIVRHTPTSMLPPETPESQVLYDADTLDRLGLMGLLRGFIGKNGSMDEILKKYMNRRLLDYDKLHFKISREIGDNKNAELEAYVAIIENRLKIRLESIENIFKAEDISQA